MLLSFRVWTFDRRHLSADSQRIDAGVDVWNFYPVSLEELQRAMKRALKYAELHSWG